MVKRRVELIRFVFSNKKKQIYIYFDNPNNYNVLNKEWVAVIKKGE